jgi:hypothetical protein
MSVGVANLLGYEFPQNFNQPYRALTTPITDDASRSNWWKLVTRWILRTSALMLSQSRTAPA